MSAARVTTVGSEVIMQPMPTVVTLRPVFPRVLYCIAGPEDGRAGEDCDCPEPEERVADAAAGKAKPAARKLRREGTLFMNASTEKTMLTSQFYNIYNVLGVARSYTRGVDVVYTDNQ
jgi:hypothetical protein